MVEHLKVVGPVLKIAKPAQRTETPSAVALWRQNRRGTFGLGSVIRFFETFTGPLKTRIATFNN
jgi:hypothetical protein